MLFSSKTFRPNGAGGFLNVFTGVAPRASWAPYFLDDQFEVEAFHVSVPARQAESPVAVLPAAESPVVVLPAAESPVVVLLAAESPVAVLPAVVLPAAVLPVVVLPAAESPVAALLAAESPVVVWAW